MGQIETQLMGVHVTISASQCNSSNDPGTSRDGQTGLKSKNKPCAACETCTSNIKTQLG